MGEQKNLLSMLVQAQGVEAQAARSFCGGPGKKSRKLLVLAGGEQHSQQVSLWHSSRELGRAKRIVLTAGAGSTF